MQINYAEVNRLNGLLTQDRRQYENVITRLKVANLNYASQVSVNTASLLEIQEGMRDSGATLISYFVLEGHTLAWVIDDQQSEIVDLPVTNLELLRDVNKLREFLKDTDRSLAGSLYAMLIAPLKPHIRHSYLIIAPHGILNTLPFAALWDGPKSRFLIEDYAITIAPSASALLLISTYHNPDKGHVLALGNPDGTLVAAEGEVAAIAKLYSGAVTLLRNQATEEQVHAHAGELDILHLSAHGVLDEDNPLFSRVELTRSPGYDGNLEVNEIYGLNLSNVNLVVLSACKAALGESSRGDELIGLVRAFHYAGAPSVVATLWSVEADSTAVLMQEFYRQLQHGDTAAIALQKSQVAMLHDNRYLPYDWAAFTLSGDARGGIAP